MFGRPILSTFARSIRPLYPGYLYISRPAQRFAMGKRKRSTAVATVDELEPTAPIPPTIPQESRRAGKRRVPATNPEDNAAVEDAQEAIRASPDAEANDALLPKQVNGVTPSSSKPSKNQKATPSAEGAVTMGDPEAEGDEGEADPEEIKEAIARPPPVNSDYLPLPWKGRLGYACLNTYLRNATPSVFSSRTTRIASILEHRHPLADPSQPEHATKNRPDKEQPADVRRGQKFVEQLCLANVRDMAKMLRWNDRYNIKFMRLSSESFPFASHAEYGYKLAPFASEALAEVGKVAAELGHRVTVHPGQFTQLGSPRQQVIDASIRDLEYHDEMLSLLKLPKQQDRDAIMVLHMGGIFGDKQATLDRFRENYKKLSPGIKNRLVLENDDMCWSVHDLLPICQELNIPFVLDFHHHNIIFDSTKIREGTKDIMELFPQIRETWTRKSITQKMHYSEPTPAALTRKQRRKHNPRVASLPPCPDDMDLMIEAKDKEQAVFELMRTFKLPGHNTFNDILPHIRPDENKPVKLPKKKATPKKGKGKNDEDAKEPEVESIAPAVVPEEDISMGGPEGRVYWPPGMEEWLRPPKRVMKKNDDKAGNANATPAKIETKVSKDILPNGNDGKQKPGKQAAKKAPGKATKKVEPAAATEPAINGVKSTPASKKKIQPRKGKPTTPKREPSMSLSDEEEEEEEGFISEDSEDAVMTPPPAKLTKRASSRKSARSKASRVSYKEEDEDDNE